MGSSNRHWPSMFKSKPTHNTHHHHQWRSHDSNNLLFSPSSLHRSPVTTSGEERSPEPKPRWNPKPEQIRILESIFNSGMVNPPRDEIRKIRVQLQEYGQVGDANVFYWFQNRKSRSKHKTRHLVKSPATNTATVTSSSSSSEKSKSSVDLILNSPTASVNQQPQPHFQEPLFFTTLQPPTTQGFCFSELGNVFNPHPTVGSSDHLLMMNNNIQQNGILNNNNNIKSHAYHQDKMMKMSTSLTPTSIVAPNPNPSTTTVQSTIPDNIQGVEEPAAALEKSTVFINDVVFEVAMGPFNVRAAFGDDAVLIHSYGQPVLTNECGVTLQSLQHGAFYYLVRSFSYDHSNAIDLM